MSDGPRCAACGEPIDGPLLRARDGSCYHHDSVACIGALRAKLDATRKERDGLRTELDDVRLELSLLEQEYDHAARNQRDEDDE